MLQNQSYSWQGVLQFLHKEHQSKSQNQNIWFLQKKGLNEQIKQLQSRVSALQNINTDLVNRNKMLEYCLRQMKGEKTQKIQQKNEDLPKVPQRRPKPNKNHVNKILQSLGIRNLIQNIQKDLELRGQNNLKIDQKIGTAREKDKQVVSMKSSQYKQTHILTGHQDGVRDLHFYQQKDMLVSVSEDCTMKVWKIQDKKEIQCFGTLRQHSGPIFTITQGQKCLFTGGMEGIIRCWNFDSVNEKKDLNKKCLVGSWKNSEEDQLEPIWQLLYSSQNKMLMSTSSECTIKAYKIDFSGEKVTANFKMSYMYDQPGSISKQQEDIPTSICLHNGNLVSGYVNNHSLIHFDLETGKIVNELKFPATGQFSTNKVISHPQLLIAAYEDKMVRLFDSNKMTYCFKAHDDSVMSIALTANINQFFTCGHDGYVKLWDLRKIQPISSFNSHLKKYDQSIHCIATNANFKAASGGADSIIKLYESNT